MMDILSLEDINLDDRNSFGGKGLMIARMAKKGFRVPETVLIPANVYHQFIRESGLHERILLEIHRKDFKEMRWDPRTGKPSEESLEELGLLELVRDLNQ